LICVLGKRHQLTYKYTCYVTGRISLSEIAEAAPTIKPRPTSPHLSIYRWQITMSLSILHRLTGMALAFGLLFLTWWVMAILYGPPAYDCFLSFTRSVIGKVFLVGWSWSLVYHKLNGIRHLFWDAGKGFQMQTATQSGMMVVIGSFVLTALIWILAYSTAPQFTGGLHG